MKSTHIIMDRFVLALLLVLCLCVWCYGEGDMDVTPMEKTEKAALYNAIQGFVGNWWNGSDLFPDPCGWTPIEVLLLTSQASLLLHCYMSNLLLPFLAVLGADKGVTCDMYGGLWYVTALNIGPIHDNSLGCAKNVEFRPQLFELKHLKSLTFFSCFRSSHQHPISIPSNGWEKLSSSLESLEFRSNPGLIGQIPTSYGGLMKLQSLVLVENGLQGDLPRNIGNLTNLKRLVMSGNWFTGQIPDMFGELTELLILDLSRNLLSGYLPLTLEHLTSLLKLDLSNNQLGGKLPREIGYLKNLTLLDLRSNNFSGELTKSLEEMYSLEQMVLANNPIGGDLVSIEWQNLQNLIIFDLSNTSLVGEIPESIAELKRLRFLGLSDNMLTGNLSPKLATMPCINALYLNGNNLTGELKFSALFYGKLGKRFEAWNNSNLCYPFGLMSTSHIPYGVKPCQADVTLLEPSSETKLGGQNLNQNSNSMASLGFSSNSVVDGFCWFLPMVVLLLNGLII
ncbi:hypothetical protein JRO89_XS05G0014100 [Xanthoceras sorbifolium]|uniref:Piriformospora indica-insensitive protein 2 n=1 Tax=Xanthoceras sorbifolium TaxID=99658 RepID=A0ABQ8I003_9ROSI|nr:hypothetical protein JRO89_XS05G0014100 [Xanthoceras sorbifolium]